MEQDHGNGVLNVGIKNNKCLVCGKANRLSRHKFCSQSCYWKSKIGKFHSWGNKISIALTGKKKSIDHIKNVVKANSGQKRPSITGEKNCNWKGDGVSYSSLHDWVTSHLGQPNKCEHCGTEETRMYHWANISGKYYRDLSDWVRLCVPCHSKFDRIRTIPSN